MIMIADFRTALRKSGEDTEDGDRLMRAWRHRHGFAKRSIHVSSLLPEAGCLADSQRRWIFEDLIGYGGVSIGLPGLVSSWQALKPIGWTDMGGKH